MHMRLHFCLRCTWLVFRLRLSGLHFCLVSKFSVPQNGSVSSQDDAFYLLASLLSFMAEHCSFPLLLLLWLVSWGPAEGQRTECCLRKFSESEFTHETASARQYNVNPHALDCRMNKAMTGGRTKTEKRSMKVSEARPLLEEGESERLINQDTVRPATAWVHSMSSLQLEVCKEQVQWATLDILLCCSCFCEPAPDGAFGIAQRLCSTCAASLPISIVWVPARDWSLLLASSTCFKVFFCRCSSQLQGRQQ